MSSWSPYNYTFNNPIRFIDPNGEDPYDPRTGGYLRINLWRDGVSWTNNRNNNTDKALLNRASRKVLGRPRERGQPDGIWEGAAYNPHTYAITETSSSAVSKLENDIFSNVDHIASYSAPNDGAWKRAAKSGTYTFLNSAFSESEVFHSDLDSYNVIQVEDNVINKVATLNRSENGEFNISSVSSFNVSFGDVQEKTKKTLFGKTKTVKYRTVTVTETTQKYENNEAIGDSESRTYSMTQRM